VACAVLATQPPIERRHWELWLLAERPGDDGEFARLSFSKHYATKRECEVDKDMLTPRLMLVPPHGIEYELVCTEKGPREEEIRWELR